MKNEKSQQAYKILVIILIFIVLSLIAYITYDNFIKDTENKVNGVDNTKEEVVDNTKEEVVDNTKEEVVDNTKEEVVDNTKEEVVDNKYVLPKRKSVLSISGSNSFLTEMPNNLTCGTKAASPLSVIVDTNGNAYLKIDCAVGTNDSSPHIAETNLFIKKLEEKNNIKFSKYNIASYGETMAYKLPIGNIAIAYNMYLATGGGNYFIFVLKDGRVAAMTDNEIISSNKINITTFNNLNNILYIVKDGMNGANREPFAVNNKGDEIYLLRYFYEWFIEYRK